VIPPGRMTGSIYRKSSNPLLKLASFTITEKGYSLKNMQGEYFDFVLEDMKNGPEKPLHAMAKVAALMYTRFRNGKLPIALVSNG